MNYMYMYMYIHVVMRDEKEGKKKQARSNKQHGKATQHTQGSQSLFLRKMSMYMYVTIMSFFVWALVGSVSLPFFSLFSS